MEYGMTDSSMFYSTFSKRQVRLSELMESSDLDFIAVNPGPSLTYLTGLKFHLMERPVVAIFPKKGPPTMIVPKMESGKLENLPFELRAFTYGENPLDWPEVFKHAAQSAKIAGGIVGVEPTRLRFLELRMMENAAPEASYFSAEEILSALRICKDRDEIESMRQAVAIAQFALEATLPMIRPGVTEHQITSELTIQLFQAGSESELPFTPIVSGGPNSAGPHASPTDRPLQNGDLLVIDWGAAHKGYISDLTRTFAIGDTEIEYVRIAQIVAEANAAGRAAAGPGVTAASIDKAARKVIADAGYGEYFTHRTGHGIGMEAHEAPYIRDGNSLTMQTGMTFTIEPGIYLPGRAGVRIEDNVAITSDGLECLSDLTRELRVLGS
jgi:Xaa-Pro dipeptidase